MSVFLIVCSVFVQYRYLVYRSATILIKADAEEVASLFFEFCISKWATQSLCHSLVKGKKVYYYTLILTTFMID
jgi:hypothetical protein